MTIQECYHQSGGNFEKASARLVTERLNDSSFPELYRVLQNGQREKAF